VLRYWRVSRGSGFSSADAGAHLFYAEKNAAEKNAKKKRVCRQPGTRAVFENHNGVSALAGAQQ
jgi:hypothetical protein